jgi:hypothetical protein
LLEQIWNTLLSSVSPYASQMQIRHIAV